MSNRVHGIKKLIIVRIITAIWALFLVWMMILQFNDPDAVLWIATYGIAAALCFLAALGLRIAPIIVVALLICLGWAVWLTPSVLMWLANHSFEFIVDEASVDLVYMERSRESLGLLIAALGLTVAWFSAVRHSKGGSTSSLIRSIE